MAMSMSLYARRKRVNTVAMALAVGAAAFGLFWLAAILWTLFMNGLAAIGVPIFTEMTPPPGGEGGGLLNAIFGSVVMTLSGIATAEMVMADLGLKVTLGSGVAAAQDHYRQSATALQKAA